MARDLLGRCARTCPLPRSASMSRRAKRQLLAASVAAVLASGVAVLPALADSGTHELAYHGYDVDVPSSWRVVDLSADPAACVRFDAPAVYLGTPGEASNCPADISGGRTAGLVISPLDTTTAATVTADTGATTNGAGAARAESVNDRIQLAVEDAGVLVSAVHNSRTEGQVRAVLDSAQLGDGAQAVQLESFRTKDAKPEAAPIVAPGTLNDNAFDTCTAQSQ